MRSIAVKLLILLGIATIFFSIFLLYQTYSLTNRRVREVVEQQASIALKFNLAIREYIAENVRPVMYKLLGPDAFMPETMSASYVARTIFEDVQKEFPDYIIKFASDNPRNPVNQAGPEELKVIEYLNNNPQLQRWEGAISITGKPYFAKFSAMRVEERCLRCHGNPDDAPAALLKRYGSTASFHRPPGKIIGLDSIAIPMAKISEKLWPELLKTFLVSALGLLLFFLFIVSVTRWLITNRLTMISRHFVTSTQQSDYLQIKPLELKGNDEICDLAVSFNTLSDKLKHFHSSLEMQVKERTGELENTAVQLREEIDQRKRAKEKLWQSETRYRSLFENMLNGFAYCQMHFDDQDRPWDFTYLEVNKAFETQTGLRDVAGKKVSEVIPGIREADPELFEIYGRVAMTGQPERFEMFVKSLQMWLWVSVYSPERGYFAAVFEVITERKKVEQELRESQERLFQAQKMETLGTLVAGVAHEINNPINLIMFNVPLLQKVWRDIHPILEKQALHEPHKKYGGLTSEFLKQDLDKLLRDMDLAANRVATIVSGLKNYAKTSDIRDKMPMQINEAVSNAMRLAQTTLKKAKIDVELELGQDLPLIEGHLQGLEQIVLNLIVNAIQAIEHENGRIRVKTGLEERKGQIVVVVSDNGKGIDPSIHDRIFDPFFSSKQAYGGTGMGLAVSYSIAKAHDGEITFESEVGRGTTFTVALPASPKGKRPRILVADDDESVRDVIVYALMRHRPYVVEEASTGAEALLKIGSFRPDLVILDVFMPDTDGLEVCRALKKDPRLSGIKVIIITGHAGDPKLDQIKNLGFEQILEKPLPIGDLLHEVDKILGAGERGNRQ